MLLRKREAMRLLNRSLCEKNAEGPGGHPTARKSGQLSLGAGANFTGCAGLDMQVGKLFNDSITGPIHGAPTCSVPRVQFNTGR